MNDLPDPAPEVVLLRMVGGPHAGDRHGPVADLGGWPLPDRLESPILTSGYYRKVSESQLPAEVAAHPNLMRGAQYEWVDARTDVETNDAPPERIP